MVSGKTKGLGANQLVTWGLKATPQRERSTWETDTGETWERGFALKVLRKQDWVIHAVPVLSRCL